MDLLRFFLDLHLGLSRPVATKMGPLLFPKFLHRLTSPLRIRKKQNRIKAAVLASKFASHPKSIENFKDDPKRKKQKQASETEPWRKKGAYQGGRQ